MEDRYLFRAQRMDNRKWAVGYLYRLSELYNPFIMSPDSGGYSCEVDINTVCQCTGLEDKNGNRIWENDIIKTRVGIAKVVWDKSGWQIEWIKDNIWRKDLFYWAIEDIQRVEVIANTFDNPELLESEE